MKFTYNWVKEYVDIPVSAEELARRLTAAGIEVSRLEKLRGDTLFEAEITSNRPDWLSIRGIAQETAAVCGRKMRRPPRAGAKKRPLRLKPIPIAVENRQDCPFYSALVIDGVRVGPSPDWLKGRLEALGCRSINAVVDITNYILFVYGEPLHAFDYAALNGGGVNVRRARQAERLVTIDGAEHLLSAGSLVIADRHRPVALAGVMGGKATEVSAQTKTILLEAALFDPAAVRATRQQAGLSSESSYRFERGVDPSIIGAARDAALELIVRYAGGRIVAASQCGRLSWRARRLVLSCGAVSQTLGVVIPAARIKRILTGLGFGCALSGPALKVAVPSGRADVQGVHDLVEEIARIYGYERIPATFPAVRPTVSGLSEYDHVCFAKGVLAATGLDEAITYTLTSPEALDALSGSMERRTAVFLKNPLSSDHSCLRSTVLPGLIAACVHNINQGQEHVGFFEIAKVFYRERGDLREELSLGIVQAGTEALLFEQGRLLDRKGLLHLKGVVTVLADRLGVKGLSFSRPEGSAGCQILLDGTVIGTVFSLSERAREFYGVKGKSLFAAEVSLAALLRLMQRDARFTPLPRYPGITRDISCAVGDSVPMDELLAACRTQAGTMLKELRITDYYRGAQIPEGARGVTMSCAYRSDERTLKESEVEPVHAGLCALLRERFGAVLR